MKISFLTAEYMTIQLLYSHIDSYLDVQSIFHPRAFLSFVLCVHLFSLLATATTTMITIMRMELRSTFYSINYCAMHQSLIMGLFFY